MLKIPGLFCTLNRSFTHSDLLPDTLVIWATLVHFLQILRMFICSITCNIRKFTVSVAVSLIRKVFKSQEAGELMVTGVFQNPNFHLKARI